MNRSYPAAALRANLPGAGTCTTTGTTLPLISSLMRAAHSLWPFKTTSELIVRTRRSERTVKYWRAEQREMSSEDFARLLRTEEGFEFLIAAMADAEPAWWRLIRALSDAAQAQKLQAVARRRLRRAVRGALDADQEITAAIARAEAAFVHDEEFYGPQIDALRAAARIPNRPLASPTREKLRR